MSSLINDIADAIIVDLNGHTFSQSVTAVRLYDPEIGLEALANPRVVVAAADKDRQATKSRSHDARGLTIHVAVQAKITARPGEDTAEIDGWMDYVDELEEFLMGLEPSTMPKVKVTAVQNKPVYSWKHLHDFRVFTSLLVLTVPVNWRRDS